MPELPEVETLRHELAAAVIGKTIKSAAVDWPKMVKPLAIGEFQEKIKGKKIIDISRRAKMLILKLSGRKFLIIHLKLTGQLIFQPAPTPSSPRPKRGSSFLGSAECSQGRIHRLSLRSLLPVAARPPRAGGDKIIVGGHPLRLRQSEASPQKGGTSDLPNKFTHGILNFTDGSKLYFNDLRKFGWMRLVDQARIDKISDEFGVEPLTKEFTLKKFLQILKKYPNRKIKQILMDQTQIAGMGNIYTDESCFCAKIMPTRIVKTLKDSEIRGLYQCIKKILKLAISKKGTSADTYVQLNGKPGGFVPYLKVYGRKGEKCKRCSGTVKRIKLNGRGTHFCDQCQK
ncbi:MAG: DNA-formamidopyrimidine glycosylase family protein [Patescibacteria group bacterium]